MEGFNIPKQKHNENEGLLEWKRTWKKGMRRNLIRLVAFLGMAFPTLQVFDKEGGEDKGENDEYLTNLFVQGNLGQGDNLGEKIVNTAYPLTVGWQTGEIIKGEHEINIPYVYGKDFEKVETTEEGKQRQEEMVAYIKEELKKSFRNEVRKGFLNKTFDVDFLDSVVFKTFQEAYPEEAERLLNYENLKPSKITITGYSSPEALIHGETSLIPGVVDEENVTLAKNRAQDPVIVKALKEAGIEVDESVPISYEGDENQFSEEELEELFTLAKSKGGQKDQERKSEEENEEDLLRSVQNLIAEYNVGKFVESDPQLQTVLDTLVGSKRQVVVHMEFETETKETYLVPIPLTLLLLSLSFYGIKDAIEQKRRQKSDGKQAESVKDRNKTSSPKSRDMEGLRGLPDERVFSERFMSKDDVALEELPHGEEGFNILYNAVAHDTAVPKHIAEELSLAGGGENFSDRQRIDKYLIEDELMVRMFKPEAWERGLEYMQINKDIYGTYIHKLWERTSSQNIDSYFKKLQEKRTEKNDKFKDEDTFNAIDLLGKDLESEKAESNFNTMANDIANHIISGYKDFLDSKPSLSKYIVSDPVEDVYAKNALADYEKLKDDTLFPSFEGGLFHGASEQEKLKWVKENFFNFKPYGLSKSLVSISNAIFQHLKDIRITYNNKLKEYERLQKIDPLKAFVFKDSFKNDTYTMGQFKNDLEKVVFNEFQNMIRNCKTPMLDALPNLKDKYLKSITQYILEKWQNHDRSFDLEPNQSFRSSEKRAGYDPLNKKMTGEDELTEYVQRRPNYDVTRRHMRMTGQPIREEQQREAIQYSNDPKKVLWAYHMAKEIFNPLTESVFIEEDDKSTSVLLDEKLLGMISEYEKSIKS